MYIGDWMSKDKLVPEVNIGLLGHVDHGKTTLTEALSGKWADTHSEEMKRGITIRLGYADVTVYRCPKCGFSVTKKCPKCFKDCKPVRALSLVDSPGHEALMATVLSGSALIDGALLLVAANEPCPQPQTREHLMVLDIMGIDNIVIAQTKLDLVTEEQAKKNHEQIKEFVEGTVAEGAPVIPISAQNKVNIDVLLEALEKEIPTPKRDPSKDPLLLVARSFDVNKPGTKAKNVKGGIIGGSLVQGKLSVGQKVEIRPGVKGDEWKPLQTEIVGLEKGGESVKEAEPGGLLGLMTNLDPRLAKSDGLGGNFLGLPGKMPKFSKTITLDIQLMKRVIGLKKAIKVEKLKTGERILIASGTGKAVATITSARPKDIEVSSQQPICSEKGRKVALSKMIQNRWRLIGYGVVK